MQSVSLYHIYKVFARFSFTRLQFEFIKKALLFFTDRRSVVNIVLRLVRQRIVKLLEQMLLLCIEVLRHVNHDPDELIAPTSAAELLNTSVPEAENRTRLRTCRKVIFNLAVKRGNINGIT